MQKALLTILITILAVWVSNGQNIEFIASAPSEVSVGERFRITFQVNKRPSDFNAPTFQGFRVLSGPNQSSSTSMQIINNRTTVTENFSYGYILEALQEGTFTIAPARMAIDGSNYQSNSLTIRVSAGKSTSPSTSPQQQPSQQAPVDQVSDKDVFIRAVPSDTNPYQGQQVIISYNIYTRLPVNQYSIDALPSFRGFWSENITAQGQPETRTQVIDGETYRVAEIYRVAVFPQRSGELKIDPLNVEVLVTLPGARRQSLFDEFFGGSPFDQRRTAKQNLRSNALTLNAKPLPLQNKPATFSGMVGSDFDVKASVNLTELKVNDASNLKITITGKGNMRMLEKPAINFPANLEVFDPNVSDNIRSTTAGVSGSRSYEFVMIPRTGGDFIIPAWSFVYFDPSTEKYITKEIDETVLKVSGEGPGQAQAGGAATQEAIRMLGTDIRFIRTGNVKLTPAGEIFYGSGLFWLLLAFPFVLFAFFVIYWRNHIRLQSNMELLRNKKAEKLARKRLKKAKEFVEKKREQEFYDEIFRALWGYLSDKLSIPVSILNKENVAGAFRAKRVPQELADSFINTLNDCEFARFAPGEKDDRMAEIYQKAFDTIITIEKDLRNKKN